MRICLRPLDAVTSRDHLYSTMFIGLRVILNAFLQLLPLLCRIVQRMLPIHRCHVLNMGRASMLQFMPHLQNMARLSKGCHHHQPRANNGKHIVLNGRHANNLSCSRTTQPVAVAPRTPTS